MPLMSMKIAGGNGKDGLMNSKLVFLLMVFLLVALGLGTHPIPLLAGPQDNAVLALHAVVPGAKGSCAPPSIPCSSYTTTAPTMTPKCIYLVVANADSAAGILGASFGIDYNQAALSLSWGYTPAGLLQFVTSTWPAPGSGNTLTWGLNQCQQTVIDPDGVHAILGAFYAYAYTDNVFEITDNTALLIDQEARVVDCNLTESILGPFAKGSFGFGSGIGFNPCLSPLPEISSILDVGNDQGRQVRITFLPSANDAPGSPTPVLSYECYRRIDPLPASSEPGDGGGKLTPASAQLAGWDFVDAFPAHGDLEYNITVPTLADSTVAGGMHWSAFLIRATTSDPYTFWDSDPDSGYSLDNLSPAAPLIPMLSASAILTWTESPETDFNYYTVYGSDADTPGPGTVLLGSTVSPTMDVSSSPFPFYLISATDFSGNEGDRAKAVSAAVTPAGTGVPIQVGPAVSMTFDNVTVSGETRLEPVSSGPAPPVGFEIVPADPALYYDLTTTAVFSGNVEICITYDPAWVQGPESGLLLYHYDVAIPGWTDITSSLDTGNNVICGVASALSPFAIVEAASQTGADPVLPVTRRLHNSYPNPFRSVTSLKLDLPEQERVTLQVVDLQGRIVRTLVEGPQGPGELLMQWDGRDDTGRSVPPGMYFLSMKSSSYQAARKVVLIR